MKKHKKKTFDNCSQLSILFFTDLKGGICDIAGNNGFVTLFMSTDQYFLPAVMTQLVFVHEIAHSFGALVYRFEFLRKRKTAVNKYYTMKLDFTDNLTTSSCFLYSQVWFKRSMLFSAVLVTHFIPCQVSWKWFFNHYIIC